MLEGEGEGGREAGRRERSCSEDSSEAEDLREAQRKTRGRRAARKAEKRREECSGAARAIRLYNTCANTLRTQVQERYVGQQRPISTRSHEEKKK